MYEKMLKVKDVINRISTRSVLQLFFPISKKSLPIDNDTQWFFLLGQMFWDFLFHKKMMLASLIFQTALHSSLDGIKKKNGTTTAKSEKVIEIGWSDK